MMTARAHHFISQCYLRGFALDRAKPLLFVTDCKEQRTFSTSPANVAHERDFHTVEAEGWEPDSVELGFASFESGVAPSLDRIVAARSIADHSDLGNVLALAALFAIKNPARRELWRRAEEQVIKHMLRLSAATKERWDSQTARMRAEGYSGPDLTYEDVRAFLAEDKYRIDVTTEHHLGLEMKTWDTVANCLWKRRWMLFRAPRGHPGFVTSDFPVCLMWADPARRGGFYQPGFGLPNTQVLFPISAELAMIGAFEIDHMEMDADDALIAQINTTVIAFSQRQVYARSSDFIFQTDESGTFARGINLLDEIRRRPKSR